MQRGKEAFARLPLLTILLLAGCASSSPRRNLAWERGAPTQVPPLARAQTPAPDLRIPGPAQATPPAIPNPHAAAPPAQPQAVVPAAAAAPAADPLTALHDLYQTAAKQYAPVESYIVRLRRREHIGGKEQPEELMLFKFRRQPFSVHMKWIGDEARGREVVYVKGQHEGKLHTRLAAGDVPLMPAGKRMAFDPHSALVRSSSRHPITEAGIGTLLERFGLTLAAQERGDTSRGTLKYLGPVQRPEFAQPCAAVEHTVPPGLDTTLPRGGKRWWFFDPVTRFPTLRITHDANGQQVEYYFYDRFELNVRLDDKDFHPELLWGK